MVADNQQDPPAVICDPEGQTFDGKLSFFGNGEFRAPPGRVVGVYFDKQRRIWRANWREGEIGKRKTKNFSVDDHGFEEARRLAIEYRLMKVTEIAQVELNGDEYDRIRLSTSRAPPQTGGPGGAARNLKKRENSDRHQYPAVHPYLGNRGMGSVHPGMFNSMMYDNEGGVDDESAAYWYSNPAILYSLYQHHMGNVWNDSEVNPYHFGDPSVNLNLGMNLQPGLMPPTDDDNMTYQPEMVEMLPEETTDPYEDPYAVQEDHDRHLDATAETFATFEDLPSMKHGLLEDAVTDSMLLGTG